MNISEKNFDKIFNYFLILISSLMIFRKPCTWLILLFAALSLFFYKKIKHDKQSIAMMLVIATPLLLEVLFFWNNDSIKMGFKSMEKSTSLLIFPLFIIGNYHRIHFFKTLRLYSVITTFLMLFFFIRFIFIFPDDFDKYLNGIDLWEMGYVFANSIGIHAPALNMHLAFVSVICLFFVFQDFKEIGKWYLKALGIIIFILSFFFVLFVNTRMALFDALIGFIVVFLFEIYRKYNFRTALITFSSATILLLGILYLFVQKNPYMKEKYSSVTFAHMDKIGKLDEVKDPQIHVFNALVTRVSIWKSAWELANQELPFGVGSADGKPELVKYFTKTNQKFLAKYEFPTHNQYLDFLLKYGFLGFIAVVIYIGFIGYIGFKTKSAIIISFFILFLTSNLTDDFLIRFDGIAFSGFWLSMFASYWLQKLRFINGN
jgi:O-antigen ligase